MKAILLPVMTLAILVASPVATADTPLEEQMEVVDGAYKRIRRTDDAAEGIKEARAGQAACLKAVALVPALIEKMPDGKDRDKALAAYKSRMGLLYVTFCKAELLFLEGKIEGVEELVDEFKSHKKEGHQQFMEEEE